MTMTLTQLRYLVAVDTHRHFGRAAEACCVSQPTLSMQLHKLEETLGVEVFDRSRKPVVPTDLGRRLVAQARVALRECDRMADLVAENEGVVAGELRLGVIPTLAPYLLPLVIPAFLARYPQVRVVVRERLTADTLDALAADELDAGLIATDQSQPGIEAEALFAEPFVAYVAPGHPLAAQPVIAPADLLVDDLWLLAEGHCLRDQVLDLCGRAAAGTQALRFEGGNLETLRIMVEHIGGLTLFPFLATRFLTDAQRSRLRPLAPPAPFRDVRLVRGRGYLKRAAVDAFGTAIREATAGLDGVRVAVI